MIGYLFRNKSGDRLVGHIELYWFLASKLLGARLFGIEVVESWLAREDFTGLGDLEALGE